MKSRTARSLRPFGTTIFAEMSDLARQHDAVNLAQGFPDFDGPSAVLEAAVKAIKSDNNQYSRSRGHPGLTSAVSRYQRAHFSLNYDPETEVGVTCGATEGIAAALLGLLDPGDEVVMMEPYYDSYAACISIAGARAQTMTLQAPDFLLDLERLESCFTDRTRVLMLNTPHNPTGRVFTKAELEGIASICIERDVVVVSDEVYEQITYTDEGHLPIATIDGMKERTLTISSGGKTFSLTGWKIGWSTGPAHLVNAQQAAHQYLTFCAATPLQVAIGEALDLMPIDYYVDLRHSYRRRRDILTEALEGAGFEPYCPEGSYFILADFSRLSDLEDAEFARKLCKEHGVAAVPPSVFYSDPPAEAKTMLRFAFSKNPQTLQSAAERLRSLKT